MYGRLSVSELHSRLRADFIDDGGDGDRETEEWRRLAKFVARPYALDPCETAAKRPRLA